MLHNHSQKINRYEAKTVVEAAMDKLTSDYWKKFEHIVDGKLKKDGEVFEALVADMLALMYRQEQIRFEPTPTTHDGSKDFVGEEK